MSREPALTAGSVVALATAVVALLVAFQVPLTDDQQAAILGVVAVVAPVAVALLTRPKVTPVASPRDRNGRPLVAANAWRGPEHLA